MAAGFGRLASGARARGGACRDLGLRDADDRLIRARAARDGAIIVTKDEDFSLFATTDPVGPRVLWVRTGNLVTRLLLVRFEGVWPEIETHLCSSVRVVELRWRARARRVARVINRSFRVGARLQTTLTPFFAMGIVSLYYLPTSTMRRFKPVLLIATAASLTARIAFADCPPDIDYSARGEYERADYVGVVRVGGVVWLDEQRRPTKLRGRLMLGTIPGGFDPYSGADYHVTPEHTFKGAPARSMTIFSENTEARTPLEIGARYLVFLDRQTVGDEYRRVGDLMIDYCGNSAPLSDAGRAIAIIEHANDYDRLETYLRGYVAHQAVSAAEPTRYAAAFTNLSGQGRSEVVVRLSGGGWCGSGGCTTLVLADERGAFKLVSKITITQLPIRVLDTRSHGWRDLGVTVGGGGIQKAFEATLSYDGRAYTANPSALPARPPPLHTGHVLISADSIGDVAGRPLIR